MSGMMTCRICGKRFVVTWPQHWVYRRKDVFLCSEDCMIVYDTQQTRKANGFGPKKTRGAEEDMAGKLTQKQREEVVEIAIQGGSPIEYLKKCGIGNPWASWGWIKESLAKKDPVKHNRLLQVETLKHAGIPLDAKLKFPHVTPANIEEVHEAADANRASFEPMPLIRLEGDKYQMKVEELEEKAAEVINGEDAGSEKQAEAIKVDRVPPVEIPEQPIQPLGLQGGVNYQLKVEESRKARKPFKVIGLETEFGTFMMGTVNGVIHFESEGNAEISMVTEDWVKMADLLPEILRELGVDA